MRFLHTADWQLGMKAAQVGAAGESVRKERLAAVERLVEVARDKQVDFVLVAGDTFEDNGVDRLLVQKTADVLARLGRPVYLIPGNHDPLVPGSVWEHPAWGVEGITVIEHAEPLPIEGGTIYPCPLHGKRSGADPTAWIPQAEAGSGIRIGVAHGTVTDILPVEPDFPIARDAAERASLDYLALGHWHSLFTVPDSKGIVHTAYSGTPEATKFGESDSGKVLLVEINEADAPPEVTPIDTGRLRWLQLEREIRSDSDLAAIRAELEELETPEATLLQLSLRGLLPPGSFAALDQLDDLVAARCLYASVDRNALRPAPDDDAWIASLPPGLLGGVAARLQELADPAYEGVRGEEETSEIASLALVELYALAQEGDRS